MYFIPWCNKSTVRNPTDWCCVVVVAEVCQHLGERVWNAIVGTSLSNTLFATAASIIDVQFHSMVNSKMYKCKQRTKPKDK